MPKFQVLMKQKKVAPVPVINSGSHIYMKTLPEMTSFKYDVWPESPNFLDSFPILEITSRSPEFQKITEFLLLSINFSRLSKLTSLKVNRETVDCTHITFLMFTLYFALTEIFFFYVLNQRWIQNPFLILKWHLNAWEPLTISPTMLRFSFLTGIWIRLSNKMMATLSNLHCSTLFLPLMI